jgi:hypothetical protein
MYSERSAAPEAGQKIRIEPLQENRMARSVAVKQVFGLLTWLGITGLAAAVAGLGSISAEAVSIGYWRIQDAGWISPCETWTA